MYNRVNNISEIASHIQKLIPDANVTFAHGRMGERALEKIMYDFIEGEIDVLVSTTIIETGLDISNVNTIIIHDADNFGLSQLYQLRGRVGRSNRTSYAFLLYKRDKMLKEVAEKRLSAIKEFTELGSGFKISMRDLEIRGAGNVLGAEQHGHMALVGYDLYCKLLNEAVEAMKGEKVYDAGKEEADFQNITLSLQKNNDTKASDETISFFENQENKNKFIELAENHTCGIMKYDAVIDNNGTISKFEKGPNRAFLLPKKENNVDKKSKDTENYDVNLNGIEKQSKKDFTQPVILIIDNKEINIDNKEIKAKNLDDLEKKIRENFSNNADKIIKKILSFPGQSCCEFNLAIQSFFFEEKGRSIIPKTETIQFKIEITNDDVYLYACSKYKIFNGDSQSYEPFCIEESKKYRLNDQEKGKYTVPTLLAEHIAVFEAKPYVTENDELAYLEIGEKKSEFNWINPKPEELVTFNVVNNAVNDEKK